MLRWIPSKTCKDEIRNDKMRRDPRIVSIKNKYGYGGVT